MVGYCLLAAEGYSPSVFWPVVAVFFVAICVVISQSLYSLIRYRNKKFSMGKRSERIWSPEDTFDPEKDVVSIEKDPNKDFVILTFADIQVWEPFRLGKKYVIYNTIKNTVEKAKPDMIVLLGDNAFYYSRQCYKKLVEIMEEIGLPWAAVFGNHDCEGNADLEALGDILSSGKHCLYRKGPRNLTGEGNFAVNITQNGEVVHTLFFFDSNSSFFEYDESTYRYIKADKEVKEKMPAFYAARLHEGKHKGEVPVGEGWGTFAYDQVQYYKWLLAGITKTNGGKKPESTLFCHVAPYEFNDAYFEWVKGGCDPEKGFGEINVKIGSAPVPSGMFDAVLEEGSTKNIIFGHEHENDLSVLYKGIRLSYAVKCGDECTTFAETLNGGSTLTIDKSGRGVNYTNIHVPLEGKRHYDKMMWYYHDQDLEREKYWEQKEAEEAAKEATNE